MTKTSSAPPASPALTWKTKLYVSAISFVTDLSRRSDGTVNRRFLSFLEPKVAPNEKPVRGVRTADVVVDPARDLWVRLFIPEGVPGGGRLPLVVFFHGGGFAFLSAASQSYDAVCRRIARRVPAAVVSVNYRLSPENRFPAPYDDGNDVLRFLDSHGGGASASAGSLLEALFEVADLSSCFLAGDSAGANIAHHVARQYTAASPTHGRIKVAGLIAIQPFFGGEERTESEVRLVGAPLVNTERTDWLWKAFLPEGADRDHEAANVFGLRGGGGDAGAGDNLGKGFPAAMVVVGGFDPLQDRQRGYCERLRERGSEARLVEYPGAIHAFYTFPEMKESGELMEEMKDFIRKHSSSSGSGEPAAVED